MALSDWTIITDGTCFKTISQEVRIDGDFSCKLKQSEGSSNFSTYVYANDPSYAALDNVKVKGMIFSPVDYYKRDDLYAGITWNSSNYTQTGNVIKRTLAGAGWINSAYSTQSITSFLSGGGLRFKYLKNGGYMVGLSRDSSSVAYTALDFAIYIGSGNKILVYEDNSPKLSDRSDHAIYCHPMDVFTIEITPNNTIQYKKNGIAFYESANSITYPLYAHFCGYNLDDAIEAKFNILNTIPQDSAINNAFLFTRLQGTTQSSQCYAFGQVSNNMVVLKGNLNTNSLTSNVIGTGIDTIDFGKVHVLSLETATIDQATVQVIARRHTYDKFVNEITANTVGNDTTKRVGLAYGASVTVANGKFGRAMNFLGRNFIRIPQSQRTTNTTYAMEFWFYPRNVISGCLMSHEMIWYNNAYNTNGCVYLVNGQLYLSGILSSSTYSTIQGNKNITPNQWYHVAVSYVSNSGNSYYYLYLDGVLCGSIGPNWWCTYSQNSGMSYYYLGVKHMLSSANLLYYQNYYDGLMDSFHYVYNNYFTSQNVTDRYNAQAGGQDVQAVADSSIIFRFEDEPFTSEIVNVIDTSSPIIQGGKAGFGMYNQSQTAGDAYFDDLTLYTEF